MWSGITNIQGPPLGIIINSDHFGGFSNLVEEFQWIKKCSQSTIEKMLLHCSTDLSACPAQTLSQLAKILVKVILNNP
jgi:hypothetical protein